VKKPSKPVNNIYRTFIAATIVLAFVAGNANNVQALRKINVLDSDGNPVTTGFRWLVEEDKTYHVPLKKNGTVDTVSGIPRIDPNWDQGKTLSVSFHQSYMPVVGNGTSSGNLRRQLRRLQLDKSKNYFISVLPDSGFTIGGAKFKGNQGSVTVYVSTHPLPTAQITIFVHEDIAPINNVWDTGEKGLEGFSIILEDAGGKYGVSAGIQSADVYGNPLCTSYQQDVDGNYLTDPDTGEFLVDVVGGGCSSGADGRVTIPNLAPGKYGIIAVPPTGSQWTQTSTIEGTKLIDAWVKANEPPFFGEFGPPGPHVSIGFVPASPNTIYKDTDILSGGSTISGQVVNLHLSRPPDTAFYNGGPFPHTTPWVGLNDASGGVLGKGLYAARTNNGSFEISGVPPGQYQLVVWDDNLDLIFAKSSITVDSSGNCNGINNCDLGDVPVFQWFTRMEHYVYFDANGNGSWDDGEGIPGQNVNLRWRDGTIYQSLSTGGEGFVPFDQTFPFFSWLVAEVDFGRFKATGVTVTVDDGGPIPFGDPWSFGDQLTPQVQGTPFDPASYYVDEVSRSEDGPVLTQAFQGFLGQTSVIQWSKGAYEPGENGGISGMVMYAVTRAEDDPELAAAEPWEPGIPGVTVNLYASDGTTLLDTTTTDSWDNSLPENCQYGINAGSETDDPYKFRGEATDCYDGLRNWNQVRPGVFDGGYAFGPEFSISEDFEGETPTWITIPDPSNPDVGYMKPGAYIVEVEPPPGYEIIRSQDKNVDFGDEYIPSPLLLAPECVGEDYQVPTYLALFPGIEAPKAGELLPSCDRKKVQLSGGANAAADFSLFTEVPIAGHIIGFILDDLANEYDPASPQFGEKYAPPFLPVSIRDWTGREISRTVSDEYGVYNALVPSTFTQNLSKPSGISPNMLTTCMNSKTRPDGSPDPLHNPQYSQFCYTFQYMPGSTTYLDTPVVPVAAFAGPDQNPLDCELPTRSPRIKSVTVGTNGVGGGPYIPADNHGVVTKNQTITITSLGRKRVPNPDYDGVGGIEPKTIRRDYRFGRRMGEVTLDGRPMAITNWSQREITVTVPAGYDFGTINEDNGVGGKQLIVTRANGMATVAGVTVQVGLRPGSDVQIVAAGGSIQDAIDAADTNDLILVAPGTYNEMVIMWKPVQLQGWGEGSTFINAVKTPIEKLAAWRAKAKNLLDNGSIDLIKGQELAFGGIEPETFFSEEGAGIFVVAKAGGSNRFKRNKNRGARVDGMTISGADTGGGVVVNGFADYLDISNLRIVNNSAFYAAGIRVGHPFIRFNNKHSDAKNNYVNIHHNSVVQNGGLDGAGGGIAMHSGSDSYAITNNYVCGNFTTADGAGIAHFGLSDRNNKKSPYPMIADNTIIFNENFNQGLPTNGGGILISGKPPLIAGNRSPGSGSVTIAGNLIQGNSAGAGDGGGIQLNRINGEDVKIKNNGTLKKFKYTVDIVNNIIVNNVAALSGGGISIQDALSVNIVHNTIAHNDNTATAGNGFAPGSPGQSDPQPGAGIASHANLTLPATLGSGFSDPVLENNIIWQNRMFYWLLDDTDPNNVLSGLCPDINGSIGLTCDDAPGPEPIFSDLAVLGTTGALTCTDCIQSGDGDPKFVAGTFNGNRQTTSFNPEITTAISAPPALDEGGNFIRLRYGPLTQTRDYHIQSGSSAVDSGSNISEVNIDFDYDLRPSGEGYDIGADEL